MTADADSEKIRELEQAVREAQAQAASERAKKQVAEQEARQALADSAAERAMREAAEQNARSASSQSSLDRAARETAERAAQEAMSMAAAERVGREEAETSLNNVSLQLRELTSKISSSVSSVSNPTTASPAAAATGHPESYSAATPNANDARASSAQPAPASAPTSSGSSLSASKASNSQAPMADGRNWLIPIAIFAGAGILFFAIASGWTIFENSVSVKTDDAFVRSDVAPLSTKASGIVKDTKVEDFQSVKAGQILVELKNDEYKARVEQSQEAIRQTEIKIEDMKQRKALQDARVAQAKSALENSRTSVLQVEDSISSAEDSIREAAAAIETANATITQSEAAVKSAAADVKRSTLERERQEALLASESATKEKVEQVVNENERTLANLEAQKAAQTKAKAELITRKAQLSKAQRQLAITQQEKSKSLLQVQNHQSEVTAQLNQRQLLDGEEKQLVSDLAAKKAALAAVTVDLDYTTVRAPIDGTVGELKVKPGQLVSAGTQVITIISAEPWVIANYRETQLVNVKEGDRADIAIDALSGIALSGHVEHIAPASGAQFSLLPPDNASGNFTKITQRIPVKISFDEKKEKLANLRPGMSVTVTLHPGSGRR